MHLFISESFYMHVKVFTSIQSVHINIKNNISWFFLHQRECYTYFPFSSANMNKGTMSSNNIST